MYVMTSKQSMQTRCSNKHLLCRKANIACNCTLLHTSFFILLFEPFVNAHSFLIVSLPSIQSAFSWCLCACCACVTHHHHTFPYNLCLTHNTQHTNHGSRFTPFFITTMPGVTTASALTSSIHYQPFRYPPPSQPSSCSEEIDDLASSYLAITEFLFKESGESGGNHSKSNVSTPPPPQEQQQLSIRKQVCCKGDQTMRDLDDVMVAVSAKKRSNGRYCIWFDKYVCVSAFYCDACSKLIMAEMLAWMLPTAI